MGIGLIEPIDEIKYHTDPSIPELLSTLSKMITTFDFNIKDVLRVLYKYTYMANGNNDNRSTRQFL